MVAVERYDIIAAEVLEVLKHVEPEVKVRIPKSLIEKLENVASKDYIVELKPNKSLENYRFRLIAGNHRGSNLKTDANGQVIQASVVPVIVELLVQNSVIVPDGY